MPDDEPGIAHMVPDIITRGSLGQRPLQIFGSGEQTRTLTYVDDIADGIVTAMLPSVPASTRTSTSPPSGALRRRDRTRDLGGVRAASRRTSNSSISRPIALDVQRRWPSVEKAKNLLGWEARTGLREGIVRTADWLRTVLPTAA